MPILNYTTSIECERTISEIQKCLVNHGATKIITDYRDKLPCAVLFCLEINGATAGFALPANYDGVLKAMKNDRKVPNSKCTKEQALKVSWRIIKVWVDAQMALVEANLADVAEVFLPYAVTKNGGTLYKNIKEKRIDVLMLTGGDK